MHKGTNLGKIYTVDTYIDRQIDFFYQQLFFYNAHSLELSS